MLKDGGDDLVRRGGGVHFEGPRRGAVGASIFRFPRQGSTQNLTEGQVFPKLLFVRLVTPLGDFRAGGALARRDILMGIKLPLATGEHPLTKQRVGVSPRRAGQRCGLHATPNPFQNPNQ